MTPEKIRSRAGRKLSLALRHQPEAIGLKLDKNGWADVTKLLRCLAKIKLPITQEDLDYIVENNNKKRFSYNEDGTKIRANQGHSIPVDLGLEPVEPPIFLYHGTASITVDVILETGLKPGLRQHVHLSADRNTALNVGQRHGRPVIILVYAQRMYADGLKIYRSANGVWLADAVPVEYLKRE